MTRFLYQKIKCGDEYDFPIIRHNILINITLKKDIIIIWYEDKIILFCA